MTPRLHQDAKKKGKRDSEWVKKNVLDDEGVRIRG
jgi:hypothetical protein